MSGLQIRQRIDENNLKIQAALNKFILTDEINKLMKENMDLREGCHHEYVNGFCKWCDVPVDFKEEKE